MSTAWSQPALEAIATLVQARTGFTYALQHPAKTEEGVRRAMAARGCPAPDAYLDVLTRDVGAMDGLIDELTIRETYFFREPRHFAFIRDHIFPALLAAHDGGRPLRAWSAGCASGEEAYSLAILMAEAGVGPEARVLGTDISQAALATARSGRFRDWSLRGAAPGFLQKWFHTAGSSWEVIERVRRRVQFAYLNLTLDTYPSHVSGTHGLDLILCRNVFIYFDAWTVDQVAARLRACLAPGGWLVTASSDPTLGKAAGLEPHVTEYGVFYRRPLAAPMETPPEAQPAPIAPAPAPMRKGREALEASPTPSRPAACLSEARRALEEGDYGHVLELLPDLGAGEEACRLHVDALVNREGPAAASAVAAQAVRRHPLSTVLQFRHAVLLSSLGRLDESEEALRRVIYLDRGLAIAHFALGALHWRRREVGPARRSYAAAERLCRAAAPDAVLPLSDGQRAIALASEAARHLAALGDERARIA